jgi:hypothetical protein
MPDGFTSMTALFLHHSSAEDVAEGMQRCTTISIHRCMCGQPQG